MKNLMRIATMGLWLGTTVFGGVSVAYPIIRERAQELGDVTPEQVDGLYAVSVFLPGPSFLTLWGSVTGRAAGFLGALVGEVAVMLPATILVLLLPLLAHLEWVGARTSGALYGAMWATGGLLVATGIEQMRKLKTTGRRLAASALMALLLLGLHPILVLAGSIASGVVYSYVRQGARKEAA